MAEPFLGEIRMVGFTFAPRGWALCDGQLLPISQNQALYSLLGTTYGGDGRTTFALPDLRGRVPIHAATAHPLGRKGGAQTETLTAAELPQHTHSLQSLTADADSRVGKGLLPAYAEEETYAGPAELVTLNEAAVAEAGEGQAHENMQPFLVLNFVIALQGLFPSRN